MSTKYNLNNNVKFEIKDIKAEADLLVTFGYIEKADDHKYTLPMWEFMRWAGKYLYVDANSKISPVIELCDAQPEDEMVIKGELIGQVIKNGLEHYLITGITVNPIKEYVVIKGEGICKYSAEKLKIRALTEVIPYRYEIDRDDTARTIKIIMHKQDFNKWMALQEQAPEPTQPTATLSLTPDELHLVMMAMEMSRHLGTPELFQSSEAAVLVNKLYSARRNAK